MLWRIAIQGLHHGGDGFLVGGRSLDCWKRFDWKFQDDGIGGECHCLVVVVLVKTSSVRR